MKTTARNQFPGTITAIDPGPVSTDVTLKLADDQEIAVTVTSHAAHGLDLLVGLTLPGGAVVTASITNDSVDALALELGNEATAVFKAYAPILAVPARKQRPPV